MPMDEIKRWVEEPFLANRSGAYVESVHRWLWVERFAADIEDAIDEELIINGNADRDAPPQGVLYAQGVRL